MSHPTLRAFIASVACTLGLASCSSGPLPRDAEWTRWGSEATAEDSNERGFLIVAGKDGRTVEGNQFARIPASLPHRRSGSQFVVTVPVSVGGIADRRYTRQLYVGRWAYDGNKDETMYLVKDGDPLPEGVPASAELDRPGTERGPGARSGMASIERELEVNLSVLVRVQGSDDPSAALPAVSKTVKVKAGKVARQDFAFDIAQLRALRPASERAWFEIEVAATCNVGGTELACRVRQDPALPESEVIGGELVGSAAVP